MKKRACERFSLPGTVLTYKKKSWLFRRHDFTRDLFPVVDLSKGGARFLCHDRLNPGTSVVIKIEIPGLDDVPEILADIRWISRNPEPSYRYQTGLSFNAYGPGRKNNPPQILQFFEKLESETA